ncbi:homoserine dehydrogenase [Peptococcus simiae]|uniref:Homoserine dehydrogenase n=1 Tax=Peptococcus simiae TaxID=1643805 RepID=A0ABW9H246_9FIRM
MKTIQVALLGFGTVGSGTFEVIMNRQREQFAHKVGADLVVKTVLVRHPAKYREQIPDQVQLTDDIDQILADEDIDIVVELIGGLEPAKTYILKALAAGKSVVSANKDLIAVAGREIYAAAAKAGKDFMFEAAAMGAIPIVHPLMEGLSANHIEEIVGIMNGTTNYILSKMAEEGWSYDQALAEATRLGYAEADPTADVEGLDAGRKVAILANLAFHCPAVFDDVYIEGITKVTAVDIAYAARFGYVIKLLGIANKQAEGVALRVYPALIDKRHPLASVNDSFNAAFVRGDAVDEAMFYGRGAGKLPTASAVVGDIIDISRNIVCGCEGRLGDSTYESCCFLPIDEVENPFFVRLTVKDSSGVLAQIGQAFGDANVSIAQVVQETLSAHDLADLVIITHSVKERNFRQALDAICNTEVVEKVESVIRVYGDIR